jgi:hypothetical protein
MNGHVITDKIQRNEKAIWATNGKEMVRNVFAQKKTA